VESHEASGSSSGLQKGVGALSVKSVVRGRHEVEVVPFSIGRVFMAQSALT